MSNYICQPVFPHFLKFIYIITLVNNTTLNPISWSVCVKKKKINLCKFQRQHPTSCFKHRKMNA